MVVLFLTSAPGFTSADFVPAAAGAGSTVLRTVLDSSQLHKKTPAKTMWVAENLEIRDRMKILKILCLSGALKV